jgi:hypothetical protein
MALPLLPHAIALRRVCFLRGVYWPVRELKAMSTDTRVHVHALIDQLAPVQLTALETLLQSMLDPLSRKLALAPIDDEPLTEDDRQSVAEADEWLRSNKPIPLEDVLADLGLTMADWEKMAQTPLPQATHFRNG